ncbi:MAG TPA: helicase HerA-like domain-containing protein [Candidatus Acidoferrales bacterium]|nr:helicase HerA-like domain-containing protein [Candidatus Acidoferrales bacterium]
MQETGRVVSVRGSTIVGETAAAENFSVGAYISIAVHDTKILGVVTSVELAPNAVVRFVANLFGKSVAGKFERGTEDLPWPGSIIEIPSESELDIIFNTYRKHDFALGEISLLSGKKNYIDPDKFFSRHIAIVGATGSGKSCTVASILQKVAKLPGARIIMIDLHDEYGEAFGDLAERVNIGEFELPYWGMNFEELVETFVDPDDPFARTETVAMSEIVLSSKRLKNLAYKDSLSVDSPVYFDLSDIKVRMQALDTERLPNGKEGPFFGNFTRFVFKFDTKFNDKRYEFLFKPKRFKTTETFSQFLDSLFGLKSGKSVVVLNLSNVPQEVTNALVSLLSRLVFDFNMWNPVRANLPILLVLEEAHNYLNPRGQSQTARRTIERVVKEGRKYGVSCMVVSQRPTDVAESILSQCSNFVTLRLSNPDDQAFIRKLIPESMGDLLDIVPVLRQGEGLLLGDACIIPLRTKIDAPDPFPRSRDVEFYTKWSILPPAVDVAGVVERWRRVNY